MTRTEERSDTAGRRLPVWLRRAKSTAKIVGVVVGLAVSFAAGDAYADFDDDDCAGVVGYDD